MVIQVRSENKISRDGRIEHLALTSPHTLVRDALTFSFQRTRHASQSSKYLTGKEKAPDKACDEGDSNEGTCHEGESNEGE